MDRIFGFIVDKRRWVMLAFLVMIAGSVYCVRQVDANYDLANYLPDDSNMKQGMDLMEKEFGQAKPDTQIRVMFTGLSEEQKSSIDRSLEDIEFVDMVEYDEESEDYNSGEYTKYVMNTAFAYGSSEEQSIEAALNENYTDYEMQYLVDDTAARSLTSVPLIIAVSILLIILLIMSASWIEPVLFILTIGAAIIINMGTNLIFGSISNTTQSIAPILQLVLSMDYSIILLNRYHQEMETVGSSTQAMKSALGKAFSSVAGSALTTIVGFLALVFMSFKIGRNIGLVLAKGVLISVICVMTILPALVLAAAPLIEKTRKKIPLIPTDGLAGLSYRFSIPAAIALIALFAGAYIMQQGTELTYTIKSKDEISQIFPTGQTIAVLYDNTDEEAMSEAEKYIENMDHVVSVTGYGNTVGEQYTADEIMDRISDLRDDTDSDIKLSESVVDLIYYTSVNGDRTYPMTMSELITYLVNDVLGNEDLADQMDESIRDRADDLLKFADAGALTSPRTASGLADYLGISGDQADKLMLLYQVESGGQSNVKMTVPKFFAFVLDELANDSQYKDQISKDTLSSLKKVRKFTDKSSMQKKRSYTDMAELFGIDDSVMRMLYIMYMQDSGDYSPEPMTLNALVKTVTGSSELSSRLDGTQLQQLQKLSQLTDPAVLGKTVNAGMLAALSGLDEEAVSGIMTLAGSTDGMSPYEFVVFVTDNIAGNEEYSAMIDESVTAQLGTIRGIMDASVSGAGYTTAQAAAILGLDEDLVSLIYAYSGSANANWKISPETLLDYISENSGKFSGSLDSSTLKQIMTVRKIVKASVSGKKYSAGDMASLTEAGKSTLNKVFLLYQSRHGSTSSWKLSVQDFAHFLDTKVLGTSVASSISSDTRDSIHAIHQLIDAVVSGTSYDPEGSYGLLSEFSDELSYNKVCLIYLMYASQAYGDGSHSMSINDLIRYIDDDMSKDPLFSDFFDTETRANIKDARNTIDEAIDKLQGSSRSRILISASGLDDMDAINSFYGDLTGKLDADLKSDHYYIGETAMSYEMSKTFGRELTLITLLTALAIFLVVLMTFRNLAVPVILVLLVQTGVYITVSIIGLQNIALYFLTLLMVECILMGSTIDYGILFTDYYTGCRNGMDRLDSLKTAYRGSIQTIMTSASIVIVITGVLSQYFPDPATCEICRNISIGALTTSLLILFVLPGTLAACDRFIKR